MHSVLQVIPAFSAGGVEHTTLHVANALAENNYKSFVASAGGDLIKRLHPKVVHFTLPTLDSKNPIHIWRNSKKLQKLIKANTINIVHARSRACGWSAYLASRDTSTRFITTYHGAYGQNCLKWYYNRVMAWGNPVVVASDFMKNHVQRFYPLSETLQIPSGIDTNYFCPNAEIASKANILRNQLGVKNDQKIILLLGRFTSIKGHQVLLNAIKSNADLKQKAHIVFLGDTGNPNLVDELKDYAKEKGINLSVYLDQKDLRIYLQVSDIVVVPTIKPEAFGRVTVESMSMQKLVIVNDLGASLEVLGDENWVYKVCDSSKNLQKKLLQAVTLSDDEVTNIGTKNRQRAIEHYDIQVMLNKHFELY